MKQQIQNIKNLIEKETGLKVSVKKNSFNGSLSGYVTFSTRKQNETYPEWTFEFAQKMKRDFYQDEPNPTFCGLQEFKYYFGNGIY